MHTEQVLRLFAIGTRNRPDPLEQSIAGLIRAVSGSARVQPARLLVLDDSNSEHDIRRNRDVVAATATPSPVGVEYLGIAEKALFNQDIVAHGQADPTLSGTAEDWIESLQFACLESVAPAKVSGPGRNRNAALLRAAGNRLISIDDDALFRFSVLDVSCTDDSVSKGRGLQDDLLAGAYADHEEMISILCPFNGDAADEILNALDIDRVPTAMTGICGNRWYERPSSFLQTPGPLRERCFFPRGNYSRNRLGPYAVLQSLGPLVDPDPFLVTCCHGADARVMLPPFPPLGRAEDSVFGFLVRYCYPESRTAHLPFAVHHVLGPPRPVDDTDFSTVSLSLGVLSRLLLQYIAGVTRMDEEDPGERLRAIGGYLGDLSRVSHADWIDLTHELYIAHTTAEIEQLGILMERYGEEPSWWARDVEEHIEVLIGQSADPLNAIPRELSIAGLSPEDATEFHRRFCEKYGALMTLWPDIWQAAVELNAESHKMSQRGD